MDFRLLRMFCADVHRTHGCLHRLETDRVVDVSEKYAPLLNNIQY
jgi:hypothetical protein